MEEALHERLFYGWEIACMAPTDENIRVIFGSST